VRIHAELAVRDPSQNQDGQGTALGASGVVGDSRPRSLRLLALGAQVGLFAAAAYVRGAPVWADCDCGYGSQGEMEDQAQALRDARWLAGKL
jgi:hypothetical protein